MVGRLILNKQPLSFCFASKISVTVMLSFSYVRVGLLIISFCFG